MSSVSLLDYPHREKELAGHTCIEIGFRTGDERKSSHLDHSAMIHFSMTWIGNTQKHEVIAQSIARMSFRIFGVPDFHFYAHNPSGPVANAVTLALGVSTPGYCIHETLFDDVP